jgi:hypothetical protein
MRSHQQNDAAELRFSGYLLSASICLAQTGSGRLLVYRLSLQVARAPRLGWRSLGADVALGYPQSGGEWDRRAAGPRWDTDALDRHGPAEASLTRAFGLADEFEGLTADPRWGL